MAHDYAQQIESQRTEIEALNAELDKNVSAHVTPKNYHIRSKLVFVWGFFAFVFVFALIIGIHRQLSYSNHLKIFKQQTSYDTVAKAYAIVQQQLEALKANNNSASDNNNSNDFQVYFFL